MALGPPQISLLLPEHGILHSVENALSVAPLASVLPVALGRVLETSKGVATLLAEGHTLLEGHVGSGSRSLVEGSARNLLDTSLLLVVADVGRGVDEVGALVDRQESGSTTDRSRST